MKFTFSSVTGVKTYGFLHKPDVLFGSFDTKDFAIIRDYASKCNYNIEPAPEAECRWIKIYSPGMKRWGWIKKVYHQNEDGTYTPDYLYGYWKGKHFATKYSIVPQISNLDRMLVDLAGGKKVIQGTRMRRIIIPDLVNDDQEREKIRSLWKKKESVL